MVDKTFWAAIPLRWLAWGLLGLGGLSLADAVRDQIKGKVEAVRPGRNAKAHVVLRAEDPKRFRNLMNYQWVRSFVFGFAGVGLLLVGRRVDACNPFSPHFKGGKAIDELGEYLDARAPGWELKEKVAPQPPDAGEGKG